MINEVRQIYFWRCTQVVEGTGFEIRQIDIIGAWVQIPPSPPMDIYFL